MLLTNQLGVSKVHSPLHNFARAMEQARSDAEADIQPRLVQASLVTTGRYLAALIIAEYRHAEATGKAYETAVLGVVDQLWVEGDRSAPKGDKRSIG